MLIGIAGAGLEIHADLGRPEVEFGGPALENRLNLPTRNIPFDSLTRNNEGPSHEG